MTPRMNSRTLKELNIRVWNGQNFRDRLYVTLNILELLRLLLQKLMFFKLMPFVLTFSLYTAYSYFLSSFTLSRLDDGWGVYTDASTTMMVQWCVRA